MNPNKLKSIIITILTMVTITSIAQTHLIPGKKAFEKKWIKHQTYHMNWFAVKDTSKFEIGDVTTQVLTDAKNITIITAVKMKNSKAPWIDTTVAEVKTLKPIRHSSYNIQRDMVLNFGKIVTGFYNDKIKNKKTFITDTTESDFFDSNLYPLLIGWLPLANDYQQKILVYDYNPNGKIGVQKVSIKNVSSSSYQTDKNGIRNVWVVTVSDEIGIGLSTYYFDKIDRRLWKQEIYANGRRMMMKLVE